MSQSSLSSHSSVVEATFCLLASVIGLVPPSAGSHLVFSVEGDGHKLTGKRNTNQHKFNMFSCTMVSPDFAHFMIVFILNFCNSQRLAVITKT